MADVSDHEEEFYADAIIDILELDLVPPKTKQCTACGENNIPAEKKHFLCRKCYIKRQKDLDDLYPDGRQCSVCCRRRIPADAPEFKTKCLTCYQSDAKTSQYRPCSRCHKMKIRVTAPPNYVLCPSCYYEK
jgi:hypothetical protein